MDPAVVFVGAGHVQPEALALDYLGDVPMKKL
jgi:hypothetical protein